MDSKPGTPARRRLASILQSDWTLVVIASLIAFLACAVQIPSRAGAGIYLTEDEFSLYSVGAHFTGRDWSLATSLTSYYSFLYPLVWIAPAFALFHDWHAVYGATLGANAFMAALIPPLAYLIGGYWGFKEIRGRWSKVLVLLFAALSGPIVAYASLGLAEVQLAVALLLTVLGLLKLQTTPSFLSAAVLGLVTMVGFFTHQRFIGVMLAVVLAVALLWVAHRIRWHHAVTFFLVAVVLYGAGNVLKQYLIRTVWLGSSTATGNDFGGRVTQLRALLDPHTWANDAQVAGGQFWSIAAASFLLVPLAVVLMVAMLGRRVAIEYRSNRFSRLYAFIRGAFGVDVTEAFLCMAAIFTYAISVIAMTGPPRLDSFFYQRYFWFVLPPVLLWVVVSLRRGALSKLRWWSVVVPWVVLTGMVVLIVRRHVGLTFMIYNAISLSTLLRSAVSSPDLIVGAVVIGIVTAVGLALLYAGRGRGGTISACVAMGVAVVLSFVSSSNASRAFTAWAEGTGAPVRTLAAELDPKLPVYVDMRGESGGIGDLANWQFTLASKSFKPFKPTRASRPGYVLVPNDTFWSPDGRSVPGKAIGATPHTTVVRTGGGYSSAAACTTGLDLLPKSVSQIDPDTADGFQDSGKRGYLALGQYLEVPQGEFELTAKLNVSEISGATDSAGEPALRADVTANAGAEVLGSREVPLQIVESGGRPTVSISLPFTASGELSNVEARVWVGEGISVTLDRLQLSCVPR